MSVQERILVGVSGSRGSTAAVRYAAHEAKRSGAALRIVHVAPAYVSLVALHPIAAEVTPAEITAMGSAILQQAVNEAGWYLSEDHVEGVLLTGERSRGIASTTDTVSMVVLGHARLGNWGRVSTASLVGLLAGSIDVPVVVVPDDWAPSEPCGRVVVGVQRLDPLPEDLLRGALQFAESRDATLEVHHVRPSTHASGHRGAAADETATSEAAAEVRQQMVNLVAEHPGVQVLVRIVTGDPTTVLTQETSRADALIIARRASGSPGGHFGTTGLALLRGAHCPVVVLPVAEEPTQAAPHAADLPRTRLTEPEPSTSS